MGFPGRTKMKRDSLGFGDCFPLVGLFLKSNVNVFAELGIIII